VHRVLLPSDECASPDSRARAILPYSIMKLPWVRCGEWAFRGFARLPSSAGSFPSLDRSFSMRFDVPSRVAADLYAHIPYSTRYR